VCGRVLGDVVVEMASASAMHHISHIADSRWRAGGMWDVGSSAAAAAGSWAAGISTKHQQHAAPAPAPAGTRDQGHRRARGAGAGAVAISHQPSDHSGETPK
jgi:hypothetical protein